MRIDQAAAAALQSRLLAVLKGQEVPTPGFKPEGAAPAQPASAAAQGSAAVPTSSLAMLVAAAAAPSPRQAVLRRAEKGLDALDRLHRMIRRGTAPHDALDELAGWRDEGGEGEGAAGALLGEVKLRILVELAKQGR